MQTRAKFAYLAELQAAPVCAPPAGWRNSQWRRSLYNARSHIRNKNGDVCVFCSEWARFVPSHQWPFSASASGIFNPLRLHSRRARKAAAKQVKGTQHIVHCVTVCFGRCVTWRVEMRVPSPRIPLLRPCEI